jgi:hypothetical protein
MEEQGYGSAIIAYSIQATDQSEVRVLVVGVLMVDICL